MSLPKSVEGPSLEVHRAGPDDLSGLLCFFEANSGSETVRHYHPFPLTEETARWITLQPHLDEYHVVQAEEGDIVGLICLRGWEEGYEVPTLGLLLDTRIRGGGVSTEMNELAAEIARARGCRRMRATVYADNAPGVGTLHSSGFVETGRTQVEVMGRTTEKITMIKEL